MHRLNNLQLCQPFVYNFHVDQMFWHDTDYFTTPTPVPSSSSETTRAQVIQNRLLELDKRLDRLQTR